MAIQPLKIRLVGIRITKLSTTSAKTRNRYRVLLAETLPIRDTETGRNERRLLNCLDSVRGKLFAAIWLQMYTIL
jgi:hypothetical protein